MIRRELGFFIFNGVLAVAITYGVYRGLVASGCPIAPANAVGYVSGMLYGFFANRSMAFRDRSSLSGAQVARYLVLHASTLLANVGINSAMLAAVRGMREDLSIAFLVAIAVSATLNFLGLKYWVFNRPAPAHGAAPNRLAQEASGAGRN